MLEVLDIMQRKFKATAPLLIKVEAELKLLEIIPAQPFAPHLPINDKEDLWIIACALQAKADCFVTGDTELLALKRVSGLPIISPRVCWDMLAI